MLPELSGQQWGIRVIAGIVAFCVGVSATVLANMFLMMMIGEINRKKQESELISYFGFTPPKTWRIFQEYRRLYSDGKLHVYAHASFGVAVISLIVMAACLYIYV